jgi:hypothetical protein
MRQGAALAIVASILATACSSDRAAATSAPTPTSTYTGTLSGMVRDDAGAPVAGALVSVGQDSRNGGTGAAQTDNQGRYAIRGLGTYQQPVGVSKPGYIRMSASVVIGVELTRDFTLFPGVVISGTTSELGILPLSGVTIIVAAGPNAGTQTASSAGPGVIGGWSLPPVLPGDITVRAAKPGYDTVERTLHAAADTWVGDVAMRSSYGGCLTSVVPILVDRVASEGQTVTINVGATNDRTWTASSTDAWLDLPKASHAGSGALSFRVQSNPIGALETRSGTVIIRCSAAESQAVYVNQQPNCQTTIRWATDSPQVFPREGGVGHIFVNNGIAHCQAVEASESDFIFLTGVSSWLSGEKFVGVRPNPTGASRTGSFVIGETRWTLTQLP